MTVLAVGLHWRLLEYDQELGRTVWIGYDDKGKPKAAHVEQEADKIIETNKLAMSHSAEAKFGDYVRIASVPLTMMEKTGLGDAVNGGDRRYLSKVLNDSDYSGFRTSRGRV